MRALSVRFPGRTIVSVAGIRRAESPDRKNAPTCSAWKKAPRKVTGWNWHPIDEWPTGDVFAYIEEHALPLHPGYSRWGSTRISCTGCILQSDPDTKAAASCPDNVPYLRELVAIETASGFSFKQSGWLADSIPQILTPAELVAVAAAKRKADERRHAESAIPKGLMYVKGWPVAVPSWPDAALLAGVRREIGALMGYEAKYTTAGAVRDRYAELMEAKAA